MDFASAVAAMQQQLAQKLQEQLPQQPDYSEAMMQASDNNVITSLAQVQSFKFAMQQASIDRQMQAAASLELGIEKLDAKLETAQLDYRLQMTQEENRHSEKMAKAGKGLSQLQNTHSLGADLPAPEADRSSDFL